MLNNQQHARDPIHRDRRQESTYEGVGVEIVRPGVRKLRRSRTLNAAIAVALVGTAGVAIAVSVSGPSNPPDSLGAVAGAPAVKQPAAGGEQAQAEALREALGAEVATLLGGEVTAGSVNWATTQVPEGLSANVLAEVTWRDAQGAVTFVAIRGEKATVSQREQCSPARSKAWSCNVLPGTRGRTTAFTMPGSKVKARTAVNLLADGSAVQVEQQAGRGEVTGEDEAFGVRIVDERPDLPLTDQQLADMALNLSGG